jgi:hypothetical protein
MLRLFFRNLRFFRKIYIFMRNAFSIAQGGILRVLILQIRPDHKIKTPAIFFRVTVVTDLVKHGNLNKYICVIYNFILKCILPNFFWLASDLKSLGKLH